MSEMRETGVFNATGPEHPLTMAEMLQEIVFETGSGARLAWVDERSLVSA
jgi:2'-hydroxyisoflavone reductase